MLPYLHINQTITDKDNLPYVILSLDESEHVPVIAMIEANREEFAKKGLRYLPGNESSFREWVGEEGYRVGIFVGDDCVGFVGAEEFRGRLGIFYAIDKNHRRKGLVTAAVEAFMTQYTKLDSGPEEMVIHARKDNRLSHRVAMRLGFSANPNSDYQRQLGARSIESLEGYTLTCEQFQSRLRAPAKVKVSP